ncbi:MAG: tRNA pseudouridine(55) synthase TruB [Bifidobacterium sp.]|uniref:tRNA pseudouridine(55) synthase TruB n=1 Tax=Bifidobacterium sp. TaxID=41200 RepID=UPI0039EC0F87
MAESGILLVDKPQGVTSHDVVAAVRGVLHTRHVGHAGTLDPMATGLLVIGFGDATRLLRYMVGHDKQYVATIRLGLATDSDDADGRIFRPDATVRKRVADIVKTISLDGLQTLVDEFFVGAIEQIPSAFSSVRVNGKHAYELARNGEKPNLAPREVTVHKFDILGLRNDDVRIHDADCRLAVDSADYVGEAADVAGGNDIDDHIDDHHDHGHDPADGHADGHADDESSVRVSVLDVFVRVSCSSGTYIRALARDLGARLGIGGHLVALRRTRVGGFLVGREESPYESSVQPANPQIADDAPLCTMAGTEVRTHVARVRVVPRELTDRKTGKLIVRNRAVMLEDAESLLKSALSPAVAASTMMNSIDISAKEAEDLSYGRIITRHVSDPTAAIYEPRHSSAPSESATATSSPRLCAILVPYRHDSAKPQTVFSNAFEEWQKKQK